MHGPPRRAAPTVVVNHARSSEAFDGQQVRAAMDAAVVVNHARSFEASAGRTVVAQQAPLITELD